MDHIPMPTNDKLVLAAQIQKITIAPGTIQTIPVSLLNRQTTEDLFELTVKGVPIEWVVLDQRVIRLGAGEQRQVDVKISIPNAPELHAGRFTIQIQAASQSDPSIRASVEGELTVAAYASQGRIGVMLGHLQHAAQPGGQVAIPLLLQNRGLTADTFRLAVRGLPAEWVSTTDSITHLGPGEQKEISFLVSPPRAAEARKGPIPFDILIHSQAAPNQPEVVRGTLNLGAFSSFSSSIQPPEVTWGNTALVSVKNNGNTPDVYMVDFLSQDGVLLFDKVARQPNPTPSGNQGNVTFNTLTAPEVLRVQPGRTGVVEFRARPRRLPIFGGDFNTPFSARVVSSNTRQEVLHNSQLLGKALIPVWVPVSLAILLAAVLCISLFSYVASQNEASRAAQTAQAETQLALLGSQTATLTGTVTATPTFTPFPSATSGIPVTGQTVVPPTPTFTFSPPPPTPTFTFTVAPPTATNTPVPPTATLTVSPLPATATTAPPPALSGTIVFQSNRDGNPEIYALNAANFNITRLTANQAADIQPALAPDGVRVAYVSNQTGNNEIFLTGTDLRTPVNLTNNPGDDQNPAWSPDGQFIAFTTNRDGNSEIYVMKADGTEAHNVSNNPANDFGPTWFQTGGLLDKQDWIAFTSNRDGNQEVYEVKPDGTGALNLTKNPANDYSPSGSSERIVFVSERDGNQEVYTMSVDGSAPANVTNNPGRDYDPVISPDGMWIAFTSERDGNPEVYVIKPDGTSATNLTKSPAQDSHPSWR